MTLFSFFSFSFHSINPNICTYYFYIRLANGTIFRLHESNASSKYCRDVSTFKNDFNSHTLFYLLHYHLTLIDKISQNFAYLQLDMQNQILTPEVVYKPWTQSMIWMIVGGFIFANALEECGLLKRTAYWIVKQCKGSFTKLLYSLHSQVVLYSF